MQIFTHCASSFCSAQPTAEVGYELVRWQTPYSGIPSRSRSSCSLLAAATLPSGFPYANVIYVQNLIFSSLSLFAPQTFHTGEKTDTCTTLQHCRQRACCYVSNEQKQGITAQDSSSFIVMDFWALLSICRCPLKHAICQVDQ